MDCHAFESWLDADRPSSGEHDAAAHAASCRACTELMAADAALDSVLVTRATTSPDFTEIVMSRVEQEQRQPVPNVDVESEMILPWWVQMLREPEILLGLSLGAIYAIGATWLFPLARDASPSLLELWARTGAALERSWPPLLIACILLPTLAFASWALYRAAAGGVDVPAHRDVAS